MRTNTAFDKKLLAPKHWLTWAGIGLLGLLAHLPWALQRRLGAGIGWLFYQSGSQRVGDTRINIALCFPEQNASAREAMVRDVFRNAGISIFEMLIAWFRDTQALQAQASFTGLEHLQAARQDGRGFLLIGAHYSTIDICAVLSTGRVHLDMIYRPQKNPVLEYLMTRSRHDSVGRMISHRDMRQLLRAIRQGHNIWYPLDQDFGAQQAVFVPFFGTPAATLTIASRLSAAHKLPVLFFGARRDGDSQRYHLTFTPALENFPSGDDVADTTRVNAELEKLIRQAPTQYMWFHRRFKTQPPGQKPPYPPKRKEIRRQKAAAAAERTRQAGPG
jgi:Kdo2-lipid IVA lauroyltransferase/acyltransferase